MQTLLLVMVLAASVEEQAARDAMKSGRYTQAVEAWERALSRSATPELWLGLAEAREAQGRLVLALYASQEAAQLAKRSGSARLESDCRARVASLKARVGFLGLRSSPPIPAGATAEVAGELIPIGAVPVSTPVDPGEVFIAWRAPGHITSTLVAQVAKGTTVTLMLPPLRPEKVEAAIPPVVPSAAPSAPQPVDASQLGAVETRKAVDTRKPLAPLLLGISGLAVTVASGAGLAVMLNQTARFQQARDQGSASLSPPYTLAEETWVKSAGFSALYTASLIGIVTGVLASAAGFTWFGLSEPVAVSAWFTAGGAAVSWSTAW
ncbi:MAG: hypothetical protein Q8S33_32740 [Myxococcales bacterium]|nr:hypothetical protein [Myxococcales bacterium]